MIQIKLLKLKENININKKAQWKNLLILPVIIILVT